MIRLGLLGAGFIGQTHAAAIAAVEGVELAVVADANREAADRLADQYGAKAYYEADRLYEDESLDAVDICLPTFLHCEAVVAAARCGKHVLCEKPVALTGRRDDRCRRARGRDGDGGAMCALLAAVRRREAVAR